MVSEGSSEPVALSEGAEGEAALRAARLLEGFGVEQERLQGEINRLNQERQAELKELRAAKERVGAQAAELRKRLCELALGDRQAEYRRQLAGGAATQTAGSSLSTQAAARPELTPEEEEYVESKFQKWKAKKDLQRGGKGSPSHK